MNGLTSFRRYQIAKVYRRDNPSKARHREFYQCDFDIAGDEIIAADFEVVRILVELLDELNIGDYEKYYRLYLLMGGSRKIRGVQNLETVRPHQLLEQMVCTAFRAAAGTLNQTRFAFTTNKLPGDMEIIQDVKRLCVVFEHVEKLLTLGSGSGNQWSHQQREIGI
ncbi:hypothetical protein Lser_V15G11920 [Lactuca serriola]